jgi:surface polysaccharide O-acyltransferase-like enzyme
MIIPLYLLTPIFVWFVRKTNTMILGVLILVLFVSKIGGYGGYFLAGYFLTQWKFKQRQSLGVAVIAIILLYVITIVSSKEKGVLVEQYWDYLNPLIIVFSAAIFSFFRNIIWPKNNLVNSLAANSYAIYLIHLLFLERLLVFTPPILFLFTLGLSWLLVIALKKIPSGSFWVG